MSEREVPPPDPRPDPYELFNEQWQKHHAALLRLLLARLKSTDDAQEALHVVYLELRNRWSVAPILRLDTYAFGIAKTIAKGWHRRRSRHQRLDQAYTDQQQLARGDTDEQTPERIYESRQELDRTLAALEQMPTGEQRLLQAATEGDATKSLAERFKLRLRTAYRHVERTRQRLREKLGLAGDSNS